MSNMSAQILRTLLDSLPNLFGLSQNELIKWMVYLEIVTTAILIPVLKCIPPPYGRHGANWGIPINAKVAWIIQEMPCFLVVSVYLMTEWSNILLVNKILLFLFFVHYFQRTFIYPVLIRGGKPTPLLTLCAAFFYCFYNSYIISVYFSKHYDGRSVPVFRFISGVALFIIGMGINIHSDYILRHLRKEHGDSGYKIPRGGLFEYVSCANFTGEILEWTGFAIAAWSLPSLAFLLFVIVNLSARSWHHHMNYLKRFPNYPKRRKALIPFIL